MNKERILNKILNVEQGVERQRGLRSRQEQQVRKDVTLKEGRM
jgi:hypothetical protein